MKILESDKCIMWFCISLARSLSVILARAHALSPTGLAVPRDELRRWKAETMLYHNKQAYDYYMHPDSKTQIKLL
jgi:hypothetical protein